MKTAFDPRHKTRQEIIKLLFSYSFTKQNIPNSPLYNDKYSWGEKTKNIIENISAIDDKIKDIAPEFPTDKINKVDLAILRLAIYELQFEKSTPPKVVVDEAIELGKEFGGDTSPGFINGALGKLLKDNN